MAKLLGVRDERKGTWGRGWAEEKGGRTMKEEKREGEAGVSGRSCWWGPPGAGRIGEWGPHQLWFDVACCTFFLPSYFTKNHSLRARVFGGNEGVRVGSTVSVCGVKRGWLPFENITNPQVELITVARRSITCLLPEPLEKTGFSPTSGIGVQANFIWISGQGRLQPSSEFVHTPGKTQDAGR